MHNKRIAQKIIGLALGLAVGVSTLPVCAGGVTFAAPAESRVQETRSNKALGRMSHRILTVERVTRPAQEWRKAICQTLMWRRAVRWSRV